MTQSDAERLWPIIANIDSGCGTCIGRFMKHARALFPEVDWEAAEDSVRFRAKRLLPYCRKRNERDSNGYGLFYELTQTVERCAE